MNALLLTMNALDILDITEELFTDEGEVYPFEKLDVFLRLVWEYTCENQCTTMGRIVIFTRLLFKTVSLALKARRGSDTGQED